MGGNQSYVFHHPYCGVLAGYCHDAVLYIAVVGIGINGVTYACGIIFYYNSGRCHRCPFGTEVASAYLLKVEVVEGGQAQRVAVRRSQVQAGGGPYCPVEACCG